MDLRKGGSNWLGRFPAHNITRRTRAPTASRRFGAPYVITRRDVQGIIRGGSTTRARKDASSASTTWANGGLGNARGVCNADARCPMAFLVAHVGGATRSPKRPHADGSSAIWPAVERPKDTTTPGGEWHPPTSRRSIFRFIRRILAVAQLVTTLDETEDVYSYCRNSDSGRGDGHRNPRPYAVGGRLACFGAHF